MSANNAQPREIKSRYGILNFKLENSGINGQPSITNAELKEFRGVLIDLDNAMMDAHVYPMAYRFRRKLHSVEMYLDARKVKF